MATVERWPISWVTHVWADAKVTAQVDADFVSSTSQYVDFNLEKVNTNHRTLSLCQIKQCISSIRMAEKIFDYKR